MSSISPFISNLFCWICYSYTLTKNWIKAFRNQFDLLFHFETYNHFLSLALICFHSLNRTFVVTCCHSLLYVVICCTTRCHLLSLDAPLVSLFVNNISMLRCECFSQVKKSRLRKIINIEIKKIFSIELYESIPIVASISLLLLIIFSVNLNGLEMN